MREIPQNLIKEKTVFTAKHSRFCYFINLNQSKWCKLRIKKSSSKNCENFDSNFY